MFDYLVGLTSDEAIAELESRGVKYELENGELLCVGSYWADDHYEVEFDDDDVIVEVYKFEGWD